MNSQSFQDSVHFGGGSEVFPHLEEMDKRGERVCLEDRSFVSVRECTDEEFLSTTAPREIAQAHGIEFFEKKGDKLLLFSCDEEIFVLEYDTEEGS